MNRQNGVSALKIKATKVWVMKYSWYSSADIISLTSEEALSGWRNEQQKYNEHFSILLKKHNTKLNM